MVWFAECSLIAIPAWCTAALARLLSCEIDGSRSWHNLAGVGFEAAVGALLTVRRDGLESRWGDRWFWVCEPLIAGDAV